MIAKERYEHFFQWKDVHAIINIIRSYSKNGFADL